MLDQFDRLVVFDTETTGIDYRRDRVIELGAVAVEGGRETGSMDALIRLPEGQSVPPLITRLTGITDALLTEEGVPPEEALSQFRALLSGAERPLLIAYNAQFDLNFLSSTLEKCCQREDSGYREFVSDMARCRYLDALTVYRDRRDYPHKLHNAIEAYGLQAEAVNSHRAADDARAAWRILEKMAEERDDLDCYINLFGVHPKYGVEGRKSPAVTYRPQPYRRTRPLYQLGEK